MRTVEEIYQDLAARFAQRTGLAAAGDSDLAVRFYAVAAQIYSLYVQAEWTRKQCFPQTAAGEQLERHAALRGITRRKADFAQGVIRFYVDEARERDVEVRGGTVCMTAGQLRFETVEDAVIEAGKLFVDVPARAAAAGQSGNAAAGTILSMAVAPAAVSACVNPEPFAGGRDEEDDEALRERVMESYARLANGANAAYYKLAAMSFGDVVAVQVVPRSRGVGTVDVVVATQAGAPEQELLDEIQAHIQAMREIAVDVRVLAPEPVSVDVAAVVTPEEGVEPELAAAKAEEAVRGWFDGSRLGCGVLRAELNALIFGLDEVGNCTITLPAQDVDISAVQLPRLGKLEIRAVSR